MAETCPQCDLPHAIGQTRCTSCGFPLTLLPMSSTPNTPTASAPLSVPGAPRPAPTQLPPARPLLRPAAALALDEEVREPWWRRTVWAMPEDVDKVDVGGRALVWMLLAWWTVSHLGFSVETGEMNNAWMHRIHLVFHEAGHIIFMLFGDFIAVLGGTLGQLLMPALFLGTFLIKYRNAFGGVATLWWLGDSMVDVAPYAYDARSQDLLLLGGVTGKDVPGYHDWNNMLGTLGWLKHDHLIGTLFYGAGAVCMVVALVWGAALLVAQYKMASKRVMF